MKKCICFYVLFSAFISILSATGLTELINPTDEISFDIFSVITAIGITQGMFLAFLLYRIRSGNHRANKILAAFLILLSLII
ncbi:MAG: hypothetical protein JW982_13730, partial [Spirochaetes bacterium]|nr:hypothetical protein [Spirochaetota bacterium]